MDLRSGSIYWLDRAVGDPAPPPSQPLAGDATCDVAIIGGGITGALCAFELTRRQIGFDVVMLDRRQLGHGSTVASTGLLQYEIDKPLQVLRSLVGRQHADRAYRLCAQAVRDFSPLVRELDDECALHERPSLYLAIHPIDLEQLQDECDARRSIGLDVEFLDESDLRHTFGISRPGALYSRPAAELDPYRLATALLRGAIGRGLRTFVNTPVDRYETDERGVILRTSAGCTLRARHVVFATGYETPAFLPREICTLRSTYAVVAAPVEQADPWPARCLIWELGDPYLYARATDENRVIVGGEDEPIVDANARDALIPAKTEALRCKLGRLFPQLDLIPEFAWAGTFAQTRDGLPYIGSAPEFPRGLFALGYGGNGIVFGLIASRILADLIVRGENEDAELFRFGR